MAFSCFVVRPFGVRTVKSPAGEPLAVDFDRIHAELIAPAMAAAGLVGSTTEAIVEAGNIREDMFQLLAHADVVIADISLHNANVFYELGARHALRKRRTFLIRFAADEVPFDLRTDRYLGYDPGDPAAAVGALAAGLRATLDDDTRVDSPIFNLLPALPAPDVAALVPVPPDFRDEVGLARAAESAGKLMLLAAEADLLPWGAEGMRLAARALVDLRAWAAARPAWERVRRRRDGDAEADLRLATILQRLGQLEASNQAVARVLDRADLSTEQRAEAYALAGSNAKQAWVDAWRDAGDSPGQRAARALHSNFLDAAQRAYARAFTVDLNHFYGGVNALAMTTLQLELAARDPEAWRNGFDDDDSADAELRRLKVELGHLAGAVHLSVRRQIERCPPGSDDARWALATAADLLLLRQERAARVVAAYQRALEGAPPYFFDVAQRQHGLYRQLGLFAEQLGALDAPLAEWEAASRRATGAQPQAAEAPRRVIVFSGHRIDAPGRPSPRFPAACERRAAAAIGQAITDAVGGIAPARVLGIAGGASGGDLLFHEACAERAIPTALQLAIPEADYIAASVAVDGQPQWQRRFQVVRERCAAAGRVDQLHAEPRLPRWLARVAGYDLWERNNRWTLATALAHGADKVCLIVLWDGQVGDGPGGTEHMVRSARAAGAEVVHLDTRSLFGPGGNCAAAT